MKLSGKVPKFNPPNHTHIQKAGYQEGREQRPTTQPISALLSYPRASQLLHSAQVFSVKKISSPFNYHGTMCSFRAVLLAHAFH